MAYIYHHEHVRHVNDLLTSNILVDLRTSGDPMLEDVPDVAAPNAFLEGVPDPIVW